MPRDPLVVSREGYTEIVPMNDHVVGVSEVELCVIADAKEEQEIGNPKEAMVPQSKGGVDAFVSMWSLMNLALPLSYFAVGFVPDFITTPLQIYVTQTLNVDSARVTVLFTVRRMPWSFKLLYGLVSDCYPIMGKRRKPYFILGWALSIAATAALAMMGSPGLHAVTGLVFLSVFGYVFADVTTDALIVERSRFESPENKGNMQAVAYMTRFFGGIVGSTLGTILHNKEHWGWGLNISQVFWLCALVQCACVIPFAYFLLDPNTCTRPRSLNEQLQSIWEMVQKRSIFLPMGAIAFFNMMQVSNPAWGNFLVIGLEFTNWFMGLRLVASSVFSWLGITFYKYYMRKYSWRVTYVVTTILVVIFSTLQLLLIFRINVKWGVSDLVFSLGDDSMESFVQAVQFLPIVVFYIGLCPDGSEGMSYAMLTTFGNVAGLAASNISTLFTPIWDVSNATLRAKDFSGVWKLTLLTSIVQPLGLAFIWLLPRNPEHQREMQKSQRKWVWGGVAFLAFLVGAWLWTMTESILVMVHGKH